MKTSVVESVRNALDIVQVIGEVVPLKKRGGGANYWGLCPFHHEKTSSFSVNSQKQFFHCFGCKKGGDLFNFVQLYYRWDFTQALEELARRAGVVYEQQKSDPTWEVGFEILNSAGEFYESGLKSKNGERFRGYLVSRKIPETLWDSFRLGAHLGGNHDLADTLSKQGFDLDIAVQLGLLGRSQKGEYYDRFQGRLMFPIMDERARIRGFGGRSLGGEEPKYLNSPKSPHFDKGRLFYGIHLASLSISKKSYAVLCEGYLDVIALHEFGISNAIGSMGTALTLEQVRLLKRWTHRVLSLYDADQAGLMATERNLGSFLKEGVESKVVLLPKAKDPDAFLHDETIKPADRKALLKDAFDNSQLAIDYLVQRQVLVEKNAMARGQKLRALVTLLNEIPDPIEKTLVKKDLAKRFDLPEELLLENSEREMARKGPEVRPAPTPQKAKPGPSGRVEMEILKFLVLFGEKQDFDLTELMGYLFSSADPSSNKQANSPVAGNEAKNSWSSILKRLIEQKVSSKQIAGLEWLNSEESEELKANVREWALQEEELLSRDVELTTIWMDLIRGLRRSYFQRESDRLQREIELAEKARDSEKARKLLTEKRDLAQWMKTQSVQASTT